MPMAATVVPSRSSVSRTSPRVVTVASRMSSGSCSTHPGWGKCWGNSRYDQARGCPCSSTANDRTPVVPASIATTTLMSRGSLLQVVEHLLVLGGLLALGLLGLLLVLFLGLARFLLLLLRLLLGGALLLAGAALARLARWRPPDAFVPGRVDRLDGHRERLGPHRRRRGRRIRRRGCCKVRRRGDRRM